MQCLVLGDARGRLMFIHSDSAYKNILTTAADGKLNESTEVIKNTENRFNWLIMYQLYLNTLTTSPTVYS